MLESLFNKFAGLKALFNNAAHIKASNFVIKRQAFSFGYCQVLKKTYFEEPLRTAASDLYLLAVGRSSHP